MEVSGQLQDEATSSPEKGLTKGQSPQSVWTQQQTGKITAPAGHQTLNVQEVTCMQSHGQNEA